MFRMTLALLLLAAPALTPAASGQQASSNTPTHDAMNQPAQHEDAKPNGVVVGVIGLILVGSLIWMGCLIEKDRKHMERGGLLPRRMVVPVFASAALILGVLAYTVFSGPPPLTGAVWVFKAVVIALVICLKSYFGPVVTGAVLSYQVYSLGVHGTLGAVPALTGLLEWLFSFAPPQLAVVFLVVQVVYCAVTSGIDLQES